MGTKQETAKTWYATPSAGHEIHGQSLVIDEADGANIAVVYDGDAHAALIASAPDLLAALQEMCEGWPTQKPDSPYFNTYNKARTAIAKATGR